MARPDWEQLSERVHLVPGGVNAAVVRAPGGAVLVDTGANADAGRALLRGLDERGWPLAAIVTTHAHADHFGGHAHILKRTRVPVYAPPVEAELMRAPVLEPVYLFHGAAPPPELRTKWLQADPSPVDHVVEAGPLEVAGVELRLVDVSGHAHRQLAIEIDDVLLAADGVFGPETIERYPMLFTHDAAGQRASAERIGGSDARIAVPGHGRPRPPAELAAATLAAIDRVRAAVVAAVVAAAAGGGATLPDVLARVARDLGLQMDDLPRYQLNLTTVAAYLGTLRAEGALDLRLAGGTLTWHAR